MPGDKIPAGKRRCSAKNHDGQRVLSESEFSKDRSQPSGYRSHCKNCRSVESKARRLNPAEREKDVERARRNHQANTDAADERDENLLARARAEAIARERRLESDFDQLKVDDFDDEYDTSVANDRSDGSLSRTAASEKRQEFSRQMGAHAVDLRRAAIADANGEGLLEDEMSPESGTYTGKLAEQERRFGNRRLARSVSLFRAGEELSRRLFVQACDQYLTGRVVPAGYAKKPHGGRIKRTVCVLLSDLHLGADLSGSDNPLPYRAIEEARRLEYVLRQVLDYKPQYRKDTKLVIMLNGDLIEGLLLHDFRDGAPLTEQKVIFLRYFEAFIGACSTAYPEVEVHCQPGNHGRDKIRHPGRATSSKWDGVENGLYYALSRACSALKNVKFSIPFRAISVIKLHGSNFLLTHGDTEVKLGDPDTKARDNLAILDKINATQIYGVEFAAAGFGHFHKPRYLPSHLRVIFNGALVPPNGHARTSGYISEVAGQFMWEATEGYPIGDVRFIEVGRAQDHDERLGSIIVPFRFDLDAGVDLAH